MKTCTKCLVNKDSTEFYANKGSSDGIRGDCKACLLASRAKKYVPHPRAVSDDLFIPCDVCGEPTWIRRATGRGSATHKKCVTPLPIEHGTVRGYRVGNCRCTECRAAVAAEMRDYKRARRESGNPIPKRSWIAASVRVEIYERDAWTCQLCFAPIDRDADSNDDWAASLDHIVPKSRGGSDDPSNLRLAHRWCNCVLSDGRKHAGLFV